VLGCYGDLPSDGVLSAREAGAAAEVAATRKEEKYAELDSRYLFEPIAVETLGVFNISVNSPLKEIGLNISLNTGDSRETGFLYQRISVLVQRFNAVLLHDSLTNDDRWLHGLIIAPTIV